MNCVLAMWAEKKVCLECQRVFTIHRNYGNRIAKIRQCCDCRRKLEVVIAKERTLRWNQKPDRSRCGTPPLRRMNFKKEHTDDEIRNRDLFDVLGELPSPN